jgi:hypothetical protein
LALSACCSSAWAVDTLTFASCSMVDGGAPVSGSVSAAEPKACVRASSEAAYVSLACDKICLVA